MVISTGKCRISNCSRKRRQMREGFPFLEDFPILSVPFTFLQGEPMRKKKWAKMAVALKACEILHKAGKYSGNIAVCVETDDEESFFC